MISAIFDALFGFVKMIFSAILEVVMKFVISPLIQVALNLVIYTLSTLWYGIMVFLLKLIDFVEMLFRMLAGLPGKDNGFGTISMTFGEESGFEGGDLLLQVIMHESVREVFLSMCIVGLFLLLITTIFKIIQVEYTTEGAKNAKGPILNKAFKGLCNMVLLPILVVFGVFLGNQVLDLLDKATTLESKNPTIASVLFTTGASEAFYTQGRQPMPLSSSDLINCASTELLINLVPIVINTFTNINWSGSGSVPEEPSVYTEEEQDTIIENFMYNEISPFIRGDYLGNIDGTSFFVDDPEERINEHLQANGISSEATPFLHSYGNAVAVTSYFNIANINYIVVFAGGVMILKSLFFACFGLIQRLYQCGMLFIISPAVIGMTPVNEGNLGKWRSKFIGQVLCAYGIVVAINLFFILVKIFLNLELTFTNKTELQGWLFSATFMEALLKGIFVIAGALLIDKFSKEIGSYFGADDAVSAGADTAKGVGSMVTKGASLAMGTAGMAMKGIGMAARGVKAAGKAGVGVAKGVAKGVGNSRVGRAVANSKVGRKVGSAVSSAKETGKGWVKEGKRQLKEAKANFGGEGFKNFKAGGRDRRLAANLSKDEVVNLSRFQELSDKKAKGALGKDEAMELDSLKAFSNVEELDQKGWNARGMDEKAYDRASAANKHFADTKAGMSAGFVKAKGAAVGFAVNHGTRFKGAMLGASSSMGGMLIPKFAQDIGKFYTDSAKKYADGSDEGKQALSNIDEAAKDRRKERMESGVLGWLYKEKNKQQDQKVAKLIVENAQFMHESQSRQAEGIIGNMNQLNDQKAKKQIDPDVYNQGIAAEMARLRALGVDQKQIVEANGKFEIQGHIGIDPVNVNKIINDALKKHGSMTKACMEEIISNAAKGKSAEEAKQVEEIVKKAISQVASGK